VIHRDVKPENVILTSDGHVKLVDFGSAYQLAKVGEPGGANGGMDGTAEYVPPEVLNGSPPDMNTDPWGVACVAFQLLAGRPPFRGGSEYITFLKIMELEVRLCGSCCCC
jgi:3-phosphoinositide dependent protein kinase-1